MKFIFKISMLFILFFYISSFSDVVSKNNSLIVVGDNVNLRIEPHSSSRIVFKLYITKTVRVLQRTGRKVTIDDKLGEWIYVDTGSYKKGSLDETIKGWVFNYYLADFEVFKPVDKFRDCSIEGMVGDAIIVYEIFKDGTYKHKLPDYETKKVYYIKGKLYRYRDVIVAMDYDKKMEIFYITPKGDLCSQQNDEKGQICARCK